MNLNDTDGVAPTRKATDEEICEWAARHDLTGSATDLRAIFEDAESHHLTRNAGVGKPDSETGG